MVEPKFKVGDNVGLKFQSEKTRLHITETMVLTCPGGTQVFYNGRVMLYNNMHSGWIAIAGDVKRYNESEVVELKE